MTTSRSASAPLTSGREARPSREPEPFPRAPIVDVGVSVAQFDAAAEQVLQWAEDRRGRYVCLSNVHMVMEAHDEPAFRDVVNGADLVLPDGMPLVWAQRLTGHAEAQRTFGPDLTERLFDLAEQRGIPVGLFGGSEASLEQFMAVVARRWPSLRVAVRIAPPFRPITPDEDATHVRAIAASGARLLFVGIGCPKQERWMAAHRARVSCVMLGVGQAFDLIAGTKRDAPRWMHRAGLAWAYRLAAEPRRLWRRYAKHNPRFIALFGAQVLRRVITAR